MSVNSRRRAFRGELWLPAGPLSGLLVLFLALTMATAVHGFDGCRAADLDGSGVVDQLDLDLIQRTGEFFLDRMDLDGDSVISWVDVLLVWRYAYPCKSCPPTRCLGCPADFDHSGAVDELDLAALWASPLGHDCKYNLNRDGMICPWDLEIFEVYVGSPRPLSRASARADFNGDGVVDNLDRQELQAVIPAGAGPFDHTCARDLNHDGTIDSDDLQLLLSSWGSCPAIPNGAKAQGFGGGQLLKMPDVCDTDDVSGAPPGWPSPGGRLPSVPSVLSDEE